MSDNSIDQDIKFMNLAVKLARDAQKKQNHPIGALITLDGNIIAKGKNSIWVPKYKPSRHAEINAIEKVPSDLWHRASNMTLYTTLEPCLMCTGTILIHRIGRIVFGSEDALGGARCVFGHMPAAFERLLAATTWVGPVLPEKCDELRKIVIALSLSHPRERGSKLPVLRKL